MNALRDDNRVPTITALQNSDGETVIPIEADATSHSLMIDDGIGGSDNGPENAGRDENRVTTLLSLSSDDDGEVVPLYATSDGEILIQSS